MFFKAMPGMSYKLNDSTVATKDIFRRVGLDRRVNSTLAIESYYVKDGETPDIISNNLYGSSNYHWVILIVNDIVNYYEEWPKNQNEIFEYTEAKYGVGNATADHHYRLKSDTSIIVDYDVDAIAEGTIEAVSNIDFEIGLNQEKRQIFVLKSEFLAKFVNNYKSLMAQ